MREIKFRAWIKRRNKMISWENLSSVANGINWLNETKCAVMQYTGLKDKNGKEIYEGDICIDNDSSDKVIVKFNEGAFWFCFDDNNKFTYDWIKKEVVNWECEVIGNIKENPELLGNKCQE